MTSNSEPFSLSRVASESAGAQLAGGFQPEVLGLDFAFTAVFLYLLLGCASGPRALLVIGVSAMTSYLTQGLSGSLHIVLGAIAGSLAGVWRASVTMFFLAIIGRGILTYLFWTGGVLLAERARGLDPFLRYLPAAVLAALLAPALAVGERGRLGRSAHRACGRALAAEPPASARSRGCNGRPAAANPGTLIGRR